MCQSFQQYTALPHGAEHHEVLRMSLSLTLFIRYLITHISYSYNSDLIAFIKTRWITMMMYNQRLNFLGALVLRIRQLPLDPWPPNYQNIEYNSVVCLTGLALQVQLKS